MIIFLLPAICPPFILEQVTPTPDASIPDSDIVTADPTITSLSNTILPAESLSLNLKLAPLP